MKLHLFETLIDTYFDDDESKFIKQIIKIIETEQKPSEKVSQLFDNLDESLLDKFKDKGDESDE